LTATSAAVDGEDAAAVAVRIGLGTAHSTTALASPVEEKLLLLEEVVHG
jgi:hypothetical protein